MTRMTYGQTWWGAQWLQALTQIDHDNRLPRGRSYANRGAVRNLEVKGGHIHARVQGSRPQPYVVNIEVPALAAADAHRLVKALAADPGMVARLLNRQLDPAVLAQAEALGVQVFPRRWSDLKMNCSCPDWAVPCKHLAAVIYLVSHEVDGDPFRVFSLRGIDLPALLSAQGVTVEAAAEQALPTRVFELFASDNETRAVPDPEALARLDFSALPDLREPLWRLLPAAPVFWRGGDFREVSAKALQRIAREARLRLLQAPPDLEAAPLLEGEPRFTAGDDGAVLLAGALRDGVELPSLPALLDALATLAPAGLSLLPPAWAALHTLRGLALHLLAQGAVAPLLLALDDDVVILRWAAAELDSRVQQAVALAAAGLPAGLVQRRQGRKWVALAPWPQARWLISAMVDALLRQLAAEPGARLAPPDKVLALFFGSGHARFDGPGEATTAGSIHTWLARLHMARQPHMPVLQLEEGAGQGFALTLAVSDERAPAQPPTPLAEVIARPAWAARRMAVLRTVALLAELHPPLNDYLRDAARTPLAVTPQALPQLLFETLPALRLMGLRVQLPRALEKLLRPRLSMQIKAGRSSAGSGFLQADAVFSFDWKVAVGDAMLTPAEFERLLGRADGIVRFRGQYVMLDAAQVQALRARLARPPTPGGPELLRAALAGEWDGAPVALNKAAEKLLAELRSETDTALPAGLNATLRPYQQRGYAWLWRNARLGLGSVIADDMGLGKTLQVLALLLRLKQEGEFAEGGALVVVPTSLLGNWQKEAARFAPDLRVAVFHGSRRELKAERPDLLLTTYGVARSEAAALRALHWRLLVVDEAQNIKNPVAAQTKALKSIAAASHVAMSGTPVENRLLEYWSIMDFAQRGFLGGPTHFTHEFATPVQVHRDQAAAARLRQVLAPFVLRRLKSDRSIIQDLPDKVEQNQLCTLAPEQAALYETVVREGLKSIAGESDTFQRQGLVLQMILALKQVCNHPAQYLKQGAADAAASGKAQRLLDLLDEILAAQEKVLVFTQFREMGELLLQMLRQRHGAGLGHEPLWLHGGVARAQRDSMVERFQTDPAQRIFLLSLKAGGTGLNLTAASQVVHYDLWWNPAVEAQATDRAYRIGQGRLVQVHRFITRGTFEERIDEMIRSKRELAEMTVGCGETWIGQLPPAELRQLFELR
jgi:uncharacterized Zn finger protein/superfamily II DNA or RNA helicase